MKARTGFVGAALLLICGHAEAQSYGNDLSSTGGITPSWTGTGASQVTLAQLASTTIDVRDYGAVCNDSTDDAPAINNAIAAGLALVTNNGSSTPVSFSFPAGPNRCLIKEPLNFTGFNAVATYVQGNGAVLDCDITATGTAPNAVNMCMDFTATSNFQINNLNLYGNPAGTQAVGMQFVRAQSNAGCTNNRIHGLTIYGAFTVTPFLNDACEDNSAVGVHITNTLNSSTSWDIIEDASNHFNVSTLYTAHPLYTPDSNSEGMDEVNWTDLVLGYGGTGSLVFINGAHANKFQGGSYFNAGNSTQAPIVLWDDSITAGNPTGIASSGNGAIWMGAHIEGGTAHDIEFEGPNPTPTVFGLHFDDRGTQISSTAAGPAASIFQLGSGITSVTLPDSPIAIDNYLTNSPATVFDVPSAYQGSGNVEVPPGMWNAPASWTGCVTQGISEGGCPIVTQGPLQAASLTNAGAIASITNSSGTPGWSESRLINGTTFPTLNIPSPPAGGQQATAAINYMVPEVNSADFTSGGGCTAGTVLTMAGGTTPGTGTLGPYQITLNTVSAGGLPLTWTTNYLGEYSAIPSDPISMTVTNGSCTTAPRMSTEAWTPAQNVVSGGVTYYGIGVTNGGAGYASAPIVTGWPVKSAGTNTFTATVGAGALTISAAGGVTVSSPLTVGVTSGTPASYACFTSSGQIVSSATACP